MQHGEGAWRALIHILAHAVFEELHELRVGRTRDPGLAHECVDSIGAVAAPLHAGDGEEARVVPAVHETVLHEVLEAALGHDVVCDVEA